MRCKVYPIILIYWSKLTPGHLHGHGSGAEPFRRLAACQVPVLGGVGSNQAPDGTWEITGSARCMEYQIFVGQGGGQTMAAYCRTSDVTSDHMLLLCWCAARPALLLAS